MKIALHPSCRLLRHDTSGLMAVDKAMGVLSHPNSQRDEDLSVCKMAYDPDEEAYLNQEGKWYLLNRLDGPTSGIILLTDNPDLAKAVRKAFEDHRIQKSYMALLKGVPPRNQDTWRDCLVTSRKGKILRTSVVRGRANAETRIEVIERSTSQPARTLVRLRPVSGKTHQLRVQCAHRHLPIIGDATYGEFAFNKEFRRRTGEKRLFLHSNQIRLEMEFRGRKLTFSVESPVPEAFTVALR